MIDTITDLTVELLVVAIQLVIVLAGGALVRWLNARFSGEQIAKAERLAGIAVQAVEQIAAAGGWRMPSVTKAVRAREKFKILAGRVGLRVTDEHIDQLIEAAVLRLRATGEELKRPAGPPAA